MSVRVTSAVLSASALGLPDPHVASYRGFPWVELHTTVPDFTDVEITVEPDGVEWRLTIVALPDNRVITQDLYPDEALALGRANDFAHLIREHWPEVRIQRQYPRSRPV
jgi:hypothetical protein